MDFIAAALSIIGGIKGKKESEKYAAKEADMELTLTRAKIEDLNLEERLTRGQTIAAAAGAGVKTDVGSPVEILREQAKNFATERMTIAQVGASKAESTTMRGKMIGRQALYQGWGQGLTQASSAMKSMFAFGG